MKVSCIIPAHNEGSTIVNVLTNVKKVRTITEIIVVDDGSTDNTYKYAKSAGVKVIKHKVNKGKGAAMKTGVKVTTGDIIVFWDADVQNMGELQIAGLNKMVQLVKTNKADIAIGTYDFTCFQTFTELIYKPLIGIFFPEVNERIKRGFLSGERVIRKNILDKIKLKDGFDVETGMNIELCLLKPTPKIEFVNLGNLNLRPKGYQKSMEIIADCVIEYAKKYKRIDKLNKSSFKRISKLLYDTVRKLE